jgi:hypothetical protein
MSLADMLGIIQENRGLYINHSLVGDAVFRSAFTHPIFLSAFLIPRSIRASRPYAALLNSYYGKAFVNILFRYFIKDDEVTDMLSKASLAKFNCADNTMELTSRALELMGTSDSPERRWVEKAFRDAKLTQIYEGTNQLNRLVVYNTEIARTLKVEVPGPFKKGVS